jgi:uncharacterized phage-associated protein
VACHDCQSNCNRFGKHRNGLQRYRCSQCRRTFTEDHTRPLGEMRLPFDKATATNAFSKKLSNLEAATPARQAGISDHVWTLKRTDWHRGGITNLLRHRLRDDPHTSMPYPAAAVANEFIKLAREANKPISPMKLQKLVYFAHGWYLAFMGKPLINEPVEAWKFGPVIPSLYHSLKAYGNRDVTDALTDNPWDSLLDHAYGSHEYSVDNGPDPQENELAKQFIKRVWDVYSGFSAVQLSNLTHNEDAPWNQTPDKEKQHTVIHQEKIREYFSRLLQKNQEKSQAPAVQNG